MGQQWIGVLLGCVKPEGMAMRDEEGTKVDDEGLLDRWEKVATKANRDAFEKNYWKARSRLVPDSPSVERGDRVVGFWVAGIEEDNDDSGEYLANGAIALRDIGSTPRCERALKEWAAFASWAKTQGIKLPKPKLYLVQTEVG